jgi:hypothetical protein
MLENSNLQKKTIGYYTAICIQAQTANIFARLFTFGTGRLPLETEMFHCSCDVLQCKA